MSVIKKALFFYLTASLTTVLTVSQPRLLAGTSVIVESNISFIVPDLIHRRCAFGGGS